MSGIISKLAVVGAFATSALAHGTVQSFVTDGKWNRGYLLQDYYTIKNGQTAPATAGWYAEDLDNGFVDGSSYAKPDIICHINAKAATSSATVAAGGTVEFQWTAWPESHMGPVITYVANCGDDCSTVDKETLKFVKIDEAGYDADTKTWASVAMIATNNTWTTTVPSTLAAGKYVFRHEIIALHGAGSTNGAQNYPQCMNIEVTGSGTESPEGTLGTELYKNTDAGILVNVYSGLTSYEIPGPALMGGATSTTPTTPASSSTPVASSTPAESSAPAESATPTATGTPISKPVSSTVPEASAAPSATGAASMAEESTHESVSPDRGIFTQKQRIGTKH
ncbi:lytic polysaccharide monooxygenase [Amniculicola lignicola CBS 123094]|uniref:Lytic polysaccharide monooxygenase n=1 Tax=Amniculicola lignicola CBS 123094 TaxID=1392246 RepID=A0A6A5WXB9_9PLEO|nr:lytic polysaccharide monooxygenase [Amniculicola lignicola CBS 123094]